MASVAWGFAREIWGRNRVALSLTVAYLLALVLLVNALPARMLDAQVVARLTIPLWCGLVFLMALFSHGDQADVVARDSGYPRRAFTLPLPAAALAGWPMALGAVAVALFWLAAGGLVLRPVGVPVPLWPAVFLAALLVWLQALTWFPFPLPFLRVLVAVPVLGAMATGAMLGYYFQISPAVLLAASAGLLPPGYLVGIAGLARARRGDAPVWHWPALRLPRLTRTPRPFASAGGALFWLEWGRRGYLLPLLVGLLIVPQVVLLYYTRDPRTATTFLIGLVVYPPIMGTAAGAALGNSHPWSRRIPTLPAFLAARPVPTAEMIAVKLRVAAYATLIAWAMVVVTILAVLPFCAAKELLLGWTQRLLDSQGIKGWTLLGVIAVGLPVLTWKWVVNQLWFGLTGRRWLGITMAVALPVGITGLGLVALWVVPHPETHAPLLDAVPWVVGGALLLKMTAGAVVVRALLRRRLVAPGLMARLAIVWVVVAAGLFGLGCWLMPPEVYSPPVIGCAAVVLGMPLTRLGLAPLALDWNRHR